MSFSISARLQQGLRYALYAGLALAASVLGNSILQSPATLYVAFDPRVFLNGIVVPLMLITGLGVLGAWLDAPDRPRWQGASLRGLVLALLMVGLVETLRRTLGAGFALGGVLKLALMLGAVGAAGLTAWRLPVASQWRLASAMAVALVLSYALQPGMLGYVTQGLTTQSSVPVPATPPGPPPRKTVVLVLDEWDLEIALKEQQFAAPPLRALLDQSFFAEHAMPGGPSTLSSIPSMLMGHRFGGVDRGGVGWLLNAKGERFDATSPSLFNDLATQGIPFAVVGYYHDYCRLASAARHCLAEPVSFFAGWPQELSRAWRVRRDFDQAYSDFLRQWSGTWAKLRADALNAVREEGNKVVWLHVNVPHPPTAAPGVVPQSLTVDYRANLQLLQQLVADMTHSLAEGGSDAALVLTSDHWLRQHELWAGIYAQQLGAGHGDAGKTDDQRVPYIVWFSRPSGAAVRLDQPVSTVSVRDLVLGLAQRRLNSPAEVAEFLKARKDEVQPFPQRSNGTGVH